MYLLDLKLIDLVILGRHLNKIVDVLLIKGYITKKIQ